VREAVGPGPLVYGDWNCGATLARRHARGRAARPRRDAGTALRDAGGLRRVRAATGLPMKLDELAHDTASLLEAHRLGFMDAVALKLSKFGGLSALRRARDLCLHLGARCASMHLGQRHRHRRRAASGCATARRGC
jgi:L-alanine-DL-glutamate epimerase-like enolase superfamily enzyme